MNRFAQTYQRPRLFKEDLIREVQEFRQIHNLQPEEVVLTGACALVMLGILDFNNACTISVRETLWQTIRSRYLEVPHTSRRRFFFKTAPNGAPCSLEARDTEEVMCTDGVYHATPEHVYNIRKQNPYDVNGLQSSFDMMVNQRLENYLHEKNGLRLELKWSKEKNSMLVYNASSEFNLVETIKEASKRCELVMTPKLIGRTHRYPVKYDAETMCLCVHHYNTKGIEPISEYLKASLGTIVKNCSGDYKLELIIS